MARRARSLTVLLNQINAAYPNRSKTSDGWIGDAAHAARESDHNPDPDGSVDAIDVTHDPVHFDAHKWARTVLIPSKDPRIKYVISNGEIWTPLRGWHKYNGANPHNKHIHISVNDVNQDDERPWSLNAAKPFTVRVKGGKTIPGAYRNPEGATVVPLRALAEALGWTVEYDADANTVTVSN